MKNIKSFTEFSSINESVNGVNLFTGVSKDNIKSIVYSARMYSQKQYKDELIPQIVNYLASEFSWRKENEVVDVMRKGATKLLYSIIPYHEVVEWLAHGGETNTWDWAHPIAIDMTGNRLKQIIPELIPYSNEEIQNATEPMLHGGFQVTGNYWLDNDKRTREELYKREKEVYDIIMSNQNKEPLFRKMDDLLKHIIEEGKI